jgi:hypothetical protein
VEVSITKPEDISGVSAIVRLDSITNLLDLSSVPWLSVKDTLPFILVISVPSLPFPFTPKTAMYPLVKLIFSEYAPAEIFNTPTKAAVEGWSSIVSIPF